jgi:hypothetical protein
LFSKAGAKLILILTLTTFSKLFFGSHPLRIFAAHLRGAKVEVISTPATLFLRKIFSFFLSENPLPSKAGCEDKPTFLSQTNLFYPFLLHHYPNLIISIT